MRKYLKIAAEVLNPLFYTAFMIAFSLYGYSLNK